MFGFAFCLFWFDYFVGGLNFCDCVWLVVSFGFDFLCVCFVLMFSVLVDLIVFIRLRVLLSGWLGLIVLCLFGLI